MGEDAVDILVEASGSQLFHQRRVDTEHSRGTGCTLSSAIAAHLARGMPLKDAVREAKSYLTGALIAGAEYRLGKGKGPVQHLWRAVVLLKCPLRSH